MSSPSRTLTEMAPTERALAWLTPRSLRLAVESGTRMRSSWSWPHVVCPFFPRTPTIVKGTFLMRMTWPTGSESAKRLRATVSPSTATFVAPSTASWANGCPATTGQSRASKNSGVMPWIWVDQLRLPHTTCAPPRMVAMRACAPEPTEIMAMTAATPMMMPSMVRMLRNLFTRRARTAMRAPARTFTPRPPLPRARWRALAARPASPPPLRP